MTIPVLLETPRGCGHRVTGGLYLMAGAPAAPCEKLPMLVPQCPTCGGGFRHSRGWTWIEPKKLFDLGPDDHAQLCMLPHCPACPCGGGAPDRAGLLWIGEKFYKTPAAFMEEAGRVGISRRISAVPRDFVAGETWIFLAHLKGVASASCRNCDHHVEQHRPRGNKRCSEEDCACVAFNGWHPTIFSAFRPTRIEIVVSEEPTEEELEAYKRRGITPVRVVKCNEQGVPLV